MAGWTCTDRESIEWDGTIKAKNGFVGDGSRLTGVTGSGAAWGTITGNLEDQTDLKTIIDGKASQAQYALTSGALVSHIANVSNPHSTTLSNLGNPTANKVFNMSNKFIDFSFTAPATGAASGAFEIEASGGFSGDLLHVHQTGTSTGAIDILHLDAEDKDVVAMLRSNSTSGTLTVDYSQNLRTSGTVSGSNIFAGFTSLSAVAASHATTSSAYYTHAASSALHNASAAIIMVLDGGGAVIASGATCDILVPYTCRIVRSTILPDASGSLSVNVWKDTYANFPPTAADNFGSLVMTSNSKYQSTTDVSSALLVTGDTIRLNASGASTTLTRGTVIFEVRKE